MKDSTITMMQVHLNYNLNLFQLQVDDSSVEEKDIELVMQQANVSKSKVCYYLIIDISNLYHKM